MDPRKKIKNKRGTTLVEVILVVALIAIMLLIAAPNVIAEKKKIDMAEMNSNARAVAVAVQSKLYGMKNAATTLSASSSEGASYQYFNEEVATDAEIVTTSKGTREAVKYISNFMPSEGSSSGVGSGYDVLTESKVIQSKSLFFSGALTESELQKGYIVIFYKADTGDIFEVFFSDQEFSIDDLLSALFQQPVPEEYLRERMIGHYYGYGVDEPQKLESMPLFSARWVWDDELRLQIKLLTPPPEDLLNTPLGMEVYLEFPALDPSDSDGKDEIMIYAEGIFGGDGYKVDDKVVKPVEYAKGKSPIPYNFIQPDTPLTLADIQNAGGVMNFALDSMVTDHVTELYNTNPDANYLARPWLRHNIAPDITNVLQDLLYPRESLAHWLDPTQNPFITVWFRRHATLEGPNSGDKTISPALFSAIGTAVSSHTPTLFVGVDEFASLRVELYELETDAYGTPKEDNKNSDLRIRKSEGGRSVTITSNRIDPYYYLLTEEDKEVGLSSMRDLANLSYVFNGVENSIEKAKLYGDITGDQHYKKLYDIRQKLININKNNANAFNERTLVGGTLPGGTISDIWAYYMNSEQTAVASMTITKKFTLSGEKLDGSGSYKIQNINFGGPDQTLGGLFKIAKGCTFRYLDIVNAHVWRRSFIAPLDEAPKKDKITEVKAYDWNRSISGSLVGFALDCTFDHVRNYIDKDHTLEVENKKGNLVSQGHTLTRVSGVVAGGLVGVAVGSDVGEGTQFTNCSASTRVCTEPYFTKQRCLYAGGLIGIAMGKVNINGCYAASQVSGWYSGGLVGMTLSNASFEGNGYNTGSTVPAIEVEKETVSNAPTIKDSFAAGQIQRTVRVGGGLIAEVQGTVSVEKCYSAVWFETMPPVAYGTFKGDQKNFYVFQTKVSIPLTANVEALFTTDNQAGLKGDILSKLQHAAGIHSGIPKTLAGIKQQQEFVGWGTATEETTHIWTWNNNDINAERFYDNMKAYPFPMPKGSGNEFWGDWIKQNYYVESADENSQIDHNPNENAPIEFQGFYSVYYPNSDSSAVSCLVPGDTIARAEPWWMRSASPGFDNMFTINTVEGKEEEVVYLRTQVPKLDAEGKPEVDEEGNTIMDIQTLPISDIRGGQYWANDNYKLGQGVDGATKVTVSEKTDFDKEGNPIHYFRFYGPTFYDPGFDPIKGYQLEGDRIQFGTLYWDYYGFYLCPLESVNNNNDDSKKYYVQFADDNDDNPDLKGGEEDNIINAVLDNENQKVIVDEDTFKKMLGYTEYILPYDVVTTITWDFGGFRNVTVKWEDGMLKIVDAQMKDEWRK